MAISYIWQGCFWQYDTNPIYCGASIARYNMKTGEYEERHFPYNPEKVTATSYTCSQHGDYLYCTVRESLMDKEATDRQEKIDIIDGKMFELVDSLPLTRKLAKFTLLMKIYTLSLQTDFANMIWTHGLQQSYIHFLRI